MRVIWQPDQWSCTCYRHIVWDWTRVCVCFPILLQGAKAFCWEQCNWGTSYFKGRKYDGCTRAHSVNGKPWCAIQVLSSLISLIKYSHHHDHQDVIASIGNIQCSMDCAMCRYQLLRLHCAGPTVSQGVQQICLFDQYYEHSHWFDINNTALSYAKFTTST